MREQAVLAFLAPGGFAAGTLLAPHLPLPADVNLGAVVRFPVSLNLVLHLLGRATTTNDILIDDRTLLFG